MNFTDIVNEVISITKRPDKVSDIRRAVNSAISDACLGTNFARDHDELSVSISSSAYTGNVALTSLARFRKVDYILPSGYRKPICSTDPKAVFDSGIEQTDRYYISGDQINYSLSALSSSLKIGYFRYPPILTDASPDFWLLEAAPYMIIDKAAATIFANIGDDSSARIHDNSWRLAYDSASVDLKYGVNHGA